MESRSHSGVMSVPVKDCVECSQWTHTTRDHINADPAGFMLCSLFHTLMEGSNSPVLVTLLPVWGEPCQEIYSDWESLVAMFQTGADAVIGETPLQPLLVDTPRRPRRACPRSCGRCQPAVAWQPPEAKEGVSTIWV